METKHFKAESKRLLDLMINSIYTHKEIFLRELISNASDAIDKLYFKSMNLGDSAVNPANFAIKIEINKETRTIIITDNGCGMTKEELEENLGTIAKSGSLAFKQENEKQENIDIIGQFGVGFYSSFMVSENVTVKTHPYGSDESWCWQSSGTDGYTIEPCAMQTVGTEIILNIKPNTEDENYDEFLEDYHIQQLIKKYSDYIRYPIKMEVEKSRLKEGSDKDYETYTEIETINSMVPIWRKNKNELKDEEYAAFYKEKFFDYEDPAQIIHSSTEGASTYKSLLFIPAKAPYNYYSREYEKGLQLYASGVLIMDKCADLLPDHFSFIKGLVDSQDLSLNISREMLQHDRQLKIIASRLEKKIKSELASMLQNDREKYEAFFKNFGLQIKFGVYNQFGANKDLLQDLLLFYSSSEKKPVTLSEYVGRMKEEQKYIYYATGTSVEKLDKMPQTELVKDKGFEILYLTEDVDEFAIQALRSFEEKEFKSVSAGDLGFESDEQKEDESIAVESKDMLSFMGEALNEKVKEVRISKRLKSHPVCISSDGMISLEMEKVLNAMPNDQKVKAERVLEINKNHPVFETLQTLFEQDKDKLSAYSKILYNQALLIEGIAIEDPVEYADLVCGLMTEKQ